MTIFYRQLYTASPYGLRTEAKFNEANVLKRYIFNRYYWLPFLYSSNVL
jgi:hypothetical protein